jgi:hypothetical protein
MTGILKYPKSFLQYRNFKSIKSPPPQIQRKQPIYINVFNVKGIAADGKNHSSNSNVENVSPTYTVLYE